MRERERALSAWGGVFPLVTFMPETPVRENNPPPPARVEVHPCAGLVQQRALQTPESEVDGVRVRSVEYQRAAI